MAVITKGDSLDALREKVSGALQDKFGSSGPNGKYTWIRDLYTDKVVYSVDGTLYAASYSILDGTVSFGKPAEVETAYKTIGESSRHLCAESDRLTEGAYNSTTGKLTITIIKPGFNKSKSRFYPDKVLKRDYGIFEGAKMFADHQTTQESNSRPEGSVHNWVASVGKPWVEADGTVKATASVIDPPFKAKLEELNKQNLLHEMGTSIRAIGEATPAEVEGTKTNLVENLVRARSVDFVTYAGAGGQVEAIESTRGDELDVDLATESILRERRPDLIQLVESHHTTTTEVEKVKTLEQQLQEATAALKEANTKNTELSEALSTQKKATAQAELSQLLTESKLPAPAVERIKKQFAEAVEVTGMKEAIDGEKEYIKSVGGGTSAASGSLVRNMGERHNGSAQESDAGASGSGEKKVNLEEAFALLPGVSKEAAKLAASARR